MAAKAVRQAQAEKAADKSENAIQVPGSDSLGGATTSAHLCEVYEARKLNEPIVRTKLRAAEDVGLRP